MYGNRNGINAYKQVNVTTADPRRLVLMCYEGALGSLKTAREKYISGEYELKGKAIQKTQDILSLLMSSLNFEKGGEIARNLEALYNYMLRRIIEGDMKKDVKAFDEVIFMLSELESAWKEVSCAPEGSCFTHDIGQEKPAALRVAGAY